MNDMDTALLAGLHSDVQALLARPPLTATRLLELVARWKGLAPAQARMAEALRLFVVTWDPLEWLVPRPESVATANAWPLEIVVYVPVWSLAEMARRRDTTIAAVLAGLGGRAVTTAAAHEDAVTSGRYAELATRGEVPDHLQAALPLAQQAKDAKAIRDLSARIFRLTRPADETVRRRQPRSRPPRSQRKGRR